MEPPVLPGRTLSPGYYLDNFERVLSVARAQYGEILSPWEGARLCDFSALPLGARRLYVRLYLRRGPYLRLRSLSYAEIPAREEAAAALARAGFVALLSSPAEEPEALALLALLSPEERAAALKALGLPRSGPRDAQLARLLPRAAEALAGERFVRVLDRGLFRRCEVLFFGNQHQDLSEFVVSDLAHVRYPRYEIVPGERLFPTRSALDAYLAAASLQGLALAEAPRELLVPLLDELFTLLAAWRPLPPLRASVDPGRYQAQLALRALRALERLDPSLAAPRYEAMLSLPLPLGVRAEAADRLGLCLSGAEAVSRFAALSAALVAEAAEDDELALLLRQRRALLGLEEPPRRWLRAAPTQEIALVGAGHQGGRALYQGPRGPSSIEHAALAAFGGDGLYAENAFHLSLVGLLFWEEIFAPIPGAFVHPFQRGPLDVWGASLYEGRRARFDARLAALARAQIADELARAYHAHHGEASHLVSWGAFPLEPLQKSAAALGPVLHSILACLVRDPFHRGAGLPDLLLFVGERAVFYEVKGPGDQLSLKQRLWHHRLLGWGAEVRLLRVKRLDPPEPRR